MANFKKRFDIYLTSDEIESIDRLVESGLYISRAEVIRDSLRHGFVRHKIRPFSQRELEAAPSEQ